MSMDTTIVSSIFTRWFILPIGNTRMVKFIPHKQPNFYAAKIVHFTETFIIGCCFTMSAFNIGFVLAKLLIYFSFNDVVLVTVIS